MQENSVSSVAIKGKEGEGREKDFDLGGTYGVYVIMMNAKHSLRWLHLPKDPTSCTRREQANRSTRCWTVKGDHILDR